MTAAPRFVPNPALARVPASTFWNVVTAMPWAEYKAIDAVSITRLKEIRRSPLHYRHAIEFERNTKAMQFGIATHVAVLEPERFERDHVVWGEKTKSGRNKPRSGKEWEEFVEVHAGKHILTGDEYLAAHRIQVAVRGDKNAMRYLSSGRAEVAMQWTRENGRTCKGRLDWLTEIDGRPVLVGLKTSRDCRPFPFGSQAAKLAYPWQWAFYADGFAQLAGVRPDVVEIVVESNAPHAIAVYRIPEEDVMAQGREEYEEALVTLAACEASNEWPGPVVDEEVLSLPDWAYAADDSEGVGDLGLEED